MSKYKVKLNKKQEYSTGATRDDVDGKGRFDLIPDIPLTRLANIFQGGGKNHGDRNWEKGLPFSRLIDSATRHLVQYKMSKYIPKLREEDHLGQAAWNIFALMHEEEMIKLGFLPKELDDLPTYVSEGCKCSSNKGCCGEQLEMPQITKSQEEQTVETDSDGNRIVKFLKGGKVMKEIKYYK